MKPTTNHQHQKRPLNLLPNEENVQQAFNFTSNLSATVDGLLAEFVERQNNARLSRQQLGDLISEAWDQFHSAHGAFADDHSIL